MSSQIFRGRLIAYTEPYQAGSQLGLETTAGGTYRLTGEILSPPDFPPAEWLGKQITVLGRVIKEGTYTESLLVLSITE